VRTTVLRQTLAVSDDLTHALVVSNRALTPGASEGDANLYMRNMATGALTFVASAPGDRAMQYYTSYNEGVTFIGGSSDFSSIVFGSLFPLTPEAPEAGIVSLYRWSANAGVKLLSVMPDGQPAPWITATPPESGPEYRFTSADTEQTLVAVEGSGVFARLGSETIALSKSTVPGEPEEPQPGWPYWMAQDGSSALFSVTSSVPLTADAPSSAGDLYEYDFESGATRYLGNQEAGIALERKEGVFAIGEDMRYVYMVDEAAQKLFVEHDGSTQLIGALPNSSASGRSVSPSGRYLAFESSAKLTEYDNEEHREVYLYDAAEKTLTCASCPDSGRASIGDAHLPLNKSELASNELPKAVTDEGMVFFDTPSRLLPADTNGVRDVYAYHAGMAQLVSPGTEPFEASFLDASASGSDLFFKTAQGLVRQDTDQFVDIYDARIGGGIAGQNQVAPAPCRGEACRASTAPLPEKAIIGSQAVQGAKPIARHRRKKEKHRHGATCARKSKGKAKHKCTKAKTRKGKAKSSKSTTRRQGR